MPRRVLIVKLSSIGDVIHALPVASALKRHDPTMRITWAVEQWTAPLVEHHPAIDRVVVFPNMAVRPQRLRGWWPSFRQAVTELRRESYDVALDLQGLARSAMVTLLSRAPVRLARAGQREGSHLVSDSVPLPAERIHAVDEYLCVARAIGADADVVDFALSPSPAARASIEQLLSRHGVNTDAPLVAINPSASRAYKQWPDARWRDVITALAGQSVVVIIGAASQAQRHAGIVAASGANVVNLTGQTSLSEVMALLQRAQLHVAPDTGTVHMAVALGTPVVAVFGPTDQTRVGPYRQPDAVVSRRRECGWECPAYCTRGRRCLRSVSANEVIDQARRALGTPRQIAAGVPVLPA